jgi:hypothetical protein
MPFDPLILSTFIRIVNLRLLEYNSNIKCLQTEENIKIIAALKGLDLQLVTLTKIVLIKPKKITRLIDQICNQSGGKWQTKKIFYFILF